MKRLILSLLLICAIQTCSPVLCVEAISYKSGVETEISDEQITLSDNSAIDSIESIEEAEVPTSFVKGDKTMPIIVVVVYGIGVVALLIYVLKKLRLF